MTDRDRPINPLLLRKDLSPAGPAAGTDAAFQQLQDHCDRLNAMNGGRDGWHVVGIAPNRTIAKRNERVDAAV